jgi:carbonic anhydrase/acetyltransferase-like protein (isoleucine patch superfamily)
MNQNRIARMYQNRRSHMSKYELTNETKKTLFGTIRRIRAVESFNDVEAGDYGGWVYSEHNLSQDGNCWVYGDARVYGNAQVFGNARVSGKARVFGNARVFGDSWVHGNARVSENAWVHGDVQVCGEARVSENARVYGNAVLSENACVRGNARVYDTALVYGFALVYGNTKVCGNTRVLGEADISNTNDILTVGIIGSRDDWTTVHKDARIGARVSCGCFTGTLDEFAAKVRETHGNNIHAQEYNALIALARIRFAHALGGGSNEKV